MCYRRDHENIIKTLLISIGNMYDEYNRRLLADWRNRDTHAFADIGSIINANRDADADEHANPNPDS